MTKEMNDIPTRALPDIEVSGDSTVPDWRVDLLLELLEEECGLTGTDAEKVARLCFQLMTDASDDGYYAAKAADDPAYDTTEMMGRHNARLARTTSPAMTAWLTAHADQETAQTAANSAAS